MTLIFKYFGLTSLHLLVETIQKKFTIKKDGVQRKPRKPKSPIHPYLTLIQQKRKIFLVPLPLDIPKK
jgi:hypothetical protein